MNIELDVKKFWEDNKKCFTPFSVDKPRVPIHFWLDDHFILEEMAVPSTLRYYNDQQYRLDINRKFNDRTEKTLGKRFCAEEMAIPIPNRFEVIMGSYWKVTEGGTPWLETTVEDIEDVKKLIDRAQRLDMKKEAFPENWQQLKEGYKIASGKKLKLGGDFSRGPATMATSILGTENTCIFIMDEPEVMEAFFETLAEKLVEYHEVLMADTGHNTREGYSFNDDNCYLFPPHQYERFCAPLMERLFIEFAPLPEHSRFQHSDSAMGHLMGILNDLGVNGVNLGPTIHPLEIRKAMPKAIIHGQIPPFTLKNGTTEEIIESVRCDIDSVGQDGGLVECPAGSVVAGTSFENLLVYMWSVETYGKY